MTGGPGTDPGAPGAAPAPDPARFPRRIHEIVERWRAERPEAPALAEAGGRTLDFAGLARAVEAAADRLRRAGVRAGDRVVILNENSIPAAAFLFACSRLDAWAVPLNARLAAPEVERLLAHCAPRALVCTHGVSAEAGAHGARHGAEEVTDPDFGAVLLRGDLPGEPEPVEPESVEPESVEPGNAGQVAALLYTSGTTGRPKGVMLTHRNLLYVAVVSGAQRGLSAGDRVYAVLPLSHVFGLSSTFLGTLQAGGSLLLVPRFDPAHLVEALAGTGQPPITVFQGVPAMYARLLEHLEGAGRSLAAPALRYMSAGGAPLDLGWKRRIEARFGLPLNNGYGLTEAAPTVAQTLSRAPRDDETIGPPLPGLEVRIVDPATGAPLPEGAVGELQVRGPTVMKGYYRDPEASAAAVTAEGWLRTGDLCRQDPDGYLFLVGRAKELIIRGGFNVYPPEVESALNAHPRVAQAGVVGRRLAGDEQVVAFVELAPGPDPAPDEAALKAFLRERLAPYKRPQRIFVLDALPASATGKLQKHRLAEMAESLCAQGETVRPGATEREGETS
ncbi:MAG: AMP-binding protein [Tistlia sp.]